MSWLIDILRSVVFWIDGIIYKLVGVVYDVFSAIATTTILSDKVLDIFSGKVYALVGIFMLFKVTFSLISYIVNPDEFVDKNKGFSKLIVNIITSLLLLVVFPFIYDEAMNIQKIVLDENIIGKIFTSSTYTLTSSVDGDFMAQETFTAFYHPNNEYNYSLNIYEIFNTDVNAKTNGDYDMYYLPVVSTIVGVILVLVLISFCFDIAVRSIKLDFLNMFAPIPIIARIDPKKGNETFNHWMKMFTSTYLDLFGRLIAIYFAIFIIGQIPNMNISSTDGSEVGLFVKVFIIMGVLLFAKQLPKLVEDLLGIKLAGNFQLNPLRKMSEVPLVGRPLAASTQFVGRTASNILGAGAHMGGQFVQNKMAETSIGQKTTDLKNKLNSYKQKGKEFYDKANLATGGHLGNIASDFDSTIGAFGRSIADDLGLLEKKERFLSNKESEILSDQASGKEIIQRNKTMAAANDAVLERAKKKVSESVQYAKRKADVDRLRTIAENQTSMIKDLESQSVQAQQSYNDYLSEYNNTTDVAERANLSQKINEAQATINRIGAELSNAQIQSQLKYNEMAAAESEFNKWANKTGVFEYVDKIGDFTTRGDDAVLDGLINKRDETAKSLSNSDHDYVSQFIGKSASVTDDNAGILKGENTNIESKFVKQEQELYEIKEQKRQLQEARRSVGDYRKFGGPKPPKH